MKIRVTMKDPDTLSDAIADAVKADVAGLAGLTDDEREVVAEKRLEAAGNTAATWFEYGEYLTVEIDTDAGTCIVQPVSH